jgi:hypothetical protein
MGPAEVLQLYRQILKAAQYFPSKKRAKIIIGIKEEFRANKVSLVSFDMHTLITQQGHSSIPVCTILQHSTGLFYLCRIFLIRSS